MSSNYLHLIPNIRVNVKLKTSFDNGAFLRFFVAMKSYAPPDALRAARALLRLSQRDLSEKINFSRQSISTAENDASAPLPTVAEMRKFYEEKGLQFLGTLDIGTGEILGAGVRWRHPEPFPPEQDSALQFHSERYGTSFYAARSLLGINRATIVATAKLSLKDLAALETGKLASTEEFQQLRSFFIEAGVEFLGLGDVSTGAYYGVGVRWAAGRKSS
jgi:DNA-binding XRE family transcriptional regulator